MDLVCYRCTSSDSVVRGLYVGCRDCGLWTERAEYQLQLQLLVLQRRLGLSSTTSSSEPTSRQGYGSRSAFMLPGRVPASASYRRTRTR